MTGEKRVDRVEIRRTGGFGGIEVRGQLAGGELTAAEEQLLRSLILQPGAESRAAADRPPAVPDVMHYELLVQLGGQPHTVTYTDLDLPPALRPLVQRLIATRPSSPGNTDRTR
jgi:hypothetical protein